MGANRSGAPSQPPSLSGYTVDTALKVVYYMCRRNDEHFPEGEVIHVTTFKPQEAADFFKERLGYDDKDATALAKRLGYLPLALEQASGRIA